MQILIVARDFKPHTGGIAEYTHQLAGQLHRLDEQVTVLAQTHPDAAEFDRACGYAVQRCDFGRLGERGPTALLARRQLLHRAVTRHRPDILLCNALGREAQASRLLCRRHGFPYVVFAYGREVVRLQTLQQQGRATRYTRVMEAVLADAARVVAISRFTQEQLQALGVPADRICLVRPGIDPADQTPPDSLVRLNLPAAVAEPQTPLLVTVARLVERKGVDTVLAALPSVRERVPTVHYVVAGDGPAGPQLADQARTLGLEGCVAFVGKVTEAEKSALLARADLFVMPNRELPDGDVEGFGIVFLEANLAGTAVIGGNSGGVPDAVADGESGLLVTPAAPAELSEAIVKLLQAPEECIRLGEQGARRARSEFAWSQSGVALRTCLAQILPRLSA